MMVVDGGLRHKDDGDVMMRKMRILWIYGDDVMYMISPG